MLIKEASRATSKPWVHSSSIPKFKAPARAHALATSWQRWQLKFSWMRRFDSLCNHKQSVTQSIINNGAQIHRRKSAIGLTNFLRFSKISNSSLMSSWFSQFLIADHNQTLGGIVPASTDLSILSYSSFTISTFDKTEQVSTSHSREQPITNQNNRNTNRSDWLPQKKRTPSQLISNTRNVARCVVEWSLGMKVTCNKKNSFKHMLRKKCSSSLKLRSESKNQNKKN